MTELWFLVQQSEKPLALLSWRNGIAWPHYGQDPVVLALVIETVGKIRPDILTTDGFT